MEEDGLTSCAELSATRNRNPPDPARPRQAVPAPAIADLFVLPGVGLLAFVSLINFQVRAQASSHGTRFQGCPGQKSVGPCNVNSNVIRGRLWPMAVGPIRRPTRGSRLPLWGKSARPDPSVGHSGSVVGPVCLERQPLALVCDKKQPGTRPVARGFTALFVT